MVDALTSSGGSNDSTGELHHKQLRWYDTFSMIIAAGVAVFITLGFTMAVLGTWGAILVAGIVAVIAVFQNVLWAELASMFPDKVGGITLFANEAWKRYCPPIGVLSTFGYWCGWSLVLGVFGIGLGSLVQAQWFASTTWAVTAPWGTKLGLAQFIAVGAILLAWLCNIIGIKVGAWMSRVLAVAFGIICVLFFAVPFARGIWHAPNLNWNISGNWQGVSGIQATVVWLYVVGWSVYPTEMPATFAPEYKEGSRDTHRALRASALGYIFMWAIMPISITGAVGDKYIAANPGSFAAGAFDRIMGGGASVAIAIMVAALFVVMVVASADASRALYGMSIDGMTLKQIGRTDRRGVPVRALTIDAVVNSAIVLFVANILSVLLAANLGYYVAIVSGLAGYVILRKTHADVPRAIRLGRRWVPVAATLALVNGFFLFEGVTNPRLTGYGGLKETLIGVGILAVSIVLFMYRRMVQDARSNDLESDPQAGHVENVVAVD